MSYDQTKTWRWKLVDWLRANPGLHFIGDVADAMSLPLGSDERRRLSHAARTLAYEGTVRSLGGQMTKRYGYLKDINPWGGHPRVKQEKAA